MKITRPKIKTTIIQFILLLALLQIWIIQCKKIELKEVLSNSNLTIAIHNSYQGSLAKARGNQGVSQDNEGVEPIGEEAPSPTDIETKIRQTFKNEADIALAVFKAESGLNPKAINWNCRYNGISQACRPGDRDKAWSVDCGIGQVNVKGKVCPSHLLEEDKNLEVCKKMYDSRGWNPWVAYTSGKYLNN